VKSVVLSILKVVSIAIPVVPQVQTSVRPQFEVVSIKSAGPIVNQITIARQPGGRLIVQGFSVRMLMARAYGVTDSRIIGGGNWLQSERFNIEAKAASKDIGPGGTITPDQLQGMLQTLLEDRFKLRLHREERDVPSFDLVSAKGGPKIKRSDDQTPPAPLPPPVLGTPVQRGPITVPDSGARGVGDRGTQPSGTRLRSSQGREMARLAVRRCRCPRSETCSRSSWDDPS